MKIKKNAFEKNGRTMKTVLASFLTLLAVGTVACIKKDTKRGTEYQRRSDGS